MASAIAGALALLLALPAPTPTFGLLDDAHDDAAPAPAGSLSATPSKVDFGDAFQGEMLVRDVTVRNTGAEPWPLASIQTSCGCTAAQIIGPGGEELPTRTPGTDPILVLQPDQEMTVKVEFRTAGKQGDIKQSMKVHHVDHRVPPLEVGVHIRVTKAIQANPAWLNLNRLSKSERVEQMVVLEAVEIGEWAIKGFTSQVETVKLPEWVSFEVLDDEGPRRRVRVVVDGDRPVGALSARVRVEIEHERIEAVDFTITGIVQPNVTFESGNATFQENVNFEQLGPDDKVTKTVKITNTDPSVPYDLEAVDIVTTQKDFFATNIRVVEPGVNYEVDVTVDGAIGAPFFRGSLMLRARHPDLPNKMIPFHGWVRK